MAGDPGRTGGSPAIAKRLACIEYSRPLRPEWLGRAGIQYQVRVLSAVGRECLEERVPARNGAECVSELHQGQELSENAHGLVRPAVAQI